MNSLGFGLYEPPRVHLLYYNPAPRMGAATSVCVCVCVPAGKSSALFLFSMLITHCPAEQHSVRV
jgi:hypothetical protein